MPRPVHLHRRDIELLELLAERRVETLAALHERLWPNATRKTAHKRLWQLSQAGYLQHLARYDDADTSRTAGGRPAAQHLYLLGAKAPTALRLRDSQAHLLARRRVKAGMPDGLIDHQLATNRVGDWLGTRLMSETDAAAGLERRLRPDAAYRATADDAGRDIVLIEVDLGHYSRSRVLDKLQGFFEHPDARSILFATPAEDRADQIARWIREAYGPEGMRRVQVFSFDELRSGALLDPGTAPAPTTDDESADWYATVVGAPGSVEEPGDNGKERP